MKKNKCRLVSLRKMVKRGKIDFKKWLLSGLMNIITWLLSGLMNIITWILSRLTNIIKGTPGFIKKTANFVCYPQYSLFVIEILFFLGLIFYSIILALPTYKLEVIKPISNFGVIKSIFNFEVIKLIFNYLVIKADLNSYKLYYLVGGLIVAILKFKSQKDFNYGNIKEQLNDTEGKGIALKTSTLKLYGLFHWYFLGLSLFLFICRVLSIGDTFINDIGIYSGLILFVFELFINSLAFSPYLFILMMVVVPTIVNSIGSNTTILNWNFLLLIFVTIIGENFFEKGLVNSLVSNKISEKNLILRKISSYIGVVFLYFGIILSENIVNTTYYYIFSLSNANPIIANLRNFVTKSFIFLLVFAVYLGAEKKITYLIFRFYYRDKTLKNSNSVVRVSLDEEKRWKVKRVKKKPKDLERIGINTYKLKKHNVIYVDKSSEIPKKIKGLNKNEGNNIIGVVNVSTIFLFLIMIAIIPINYCLDRQVRVDDGIYKIVEKSDKTDNVGEIIKVSGDAIVYKGKVEALDKRTQSFEHGTISIRKNEENILTKYLRGEKDREDKNSYIELTINQGEKKDKKIEKYKKIKE